MVRGAFLLPVGKPDLVPPDEGERHKAVIDIHFVITGADTPAPLLYSIRAPVYGEAEVGKPAAGHFAFDLFSIFKPQQRTQTYFLFAFSREVMAGPQPIAIVASDALAAPVT